MKRIFESDRDDEAGSEENLITGASQFFPPVTTIKASVVTVTKFRVSYTQNIVDS